MKRYLLGSLLLLLILLSTGCKKSIVGKWKAQNVNYDFYYIFNKDNTCSYEMTKAKLDCTYKINDKELTILYDGNTKANTFT